MPKGARGRPRKLVHAERTTRSSKAKNLQYGLEDPEQAEKQLTAQLKAMGLYAANTLGDGNCLFRALSDQLYGYPNQHPHIRHAICDYLQSHPEKYAGFVDDAKPFDAYVRNMREQGTYGGHLELSAFAHLKRKQIKIVQPNLVYVVAADDEDDEPQSESQIVNDSQAVVGPINAGELPPTARQMRRLKREAKEGPVLPADPGSAVLSSPGASSTASTSASSSTAIAVPSPASAVIPPSPSILTSSANHSSAAPATPSGSRTTVKSTPVRTPAVVPVIVEANGPLYIAYHNWEHYSSIRNLEGPHQGLPRIREKPINQADLAKEFSSIAAKAARRGGLPLGKGKAKANTRPGTSSLDAEQPSEEEKLVMDSAPGHSLFEVRQLLKLLGSWEDVVEKLVAEDQVESEAAARSRPQQLVTDAESRLGKTGPTSLQLSGEVINGPGGVEDDVIVITDDEDGPVSRRSSANPIGTMPAVSGQVQAVRNAASHASSSASNLAHAQSPGEIAWRAGSPSSVGTAASARSSASMVTAGTSTSTSTVPTSDDWNADPISGGLRIPGSSILGGRKSSVDEADAEDGKQYLALSPDSTLTTRDMSILEDGRRQHITSGEGGDEAARASPLMFKRKAHQGHDVGADGDDDSEMSHKRFSPARGQFVENGLVQPTTSGGVSDPLRMVPSSVSPTSSADNAGEVRSGTGPRLGNPTAAPRMPGMIAKSGLSRMDAISVGSGSNSDSDVPVTALLRVPSELSRAVPSSSCFPASSSSSSPQRRHPTHVTNSGGSGTSTDEDSIATSRPRRSSATPVNYRASALGRSGAPGPGQQPVSLAAAAVPAPTKRAKRDEKRAEKVERERAKARSRRLGRGLGVADDDDDEEEDGGEEGQAGVPPAQFAFRELRI
ncbi:unnamed protein product [Tilletia laevis]|uniref:OTU domain-containing protein n=3 Tax=Tilletia TaxID=13289 RepID=A0A8X7MZR7_9BASI|nr:hypothetical protein CF328_g970 [Tilletia controversa]KAE8208232.1 hypothetical protein CF335_g578 [Tilletia laevis]KAE8264852.1 hypothetical protein A4X03_0g653 [Tilletia caries]KAE8253607.1 hypothetical protein A4X06_0g1326 [Tilletia controversa]CAD6941715.1 unnamed protein product [Tilletia caries]